MEAPRKDGSIWSHANAGKIEKVVYRSWTNEQDSIDPDTDTDYSITSMDGMRGLAKDWWVHRRWLIPVVSVALLAIILISTAALVVHARQPYLTVAQVKQGNLTLSFQTTGTLRSAVYGADFAVTGIVAEIDVTVGQHVSQGDTLAKLNTTLLQACGRAGAGRQQWRVIGAFQRADASG